MCPYFKLHTGKLASEIGVKTFYGKRDGSIPNTNELNPDLLVAPMAKVLDLEYEGAPAGYTEQALKKMKNPIFGNIILLGALAATDSVPLDREDFEEAITVSMPKDKMKINMMAYDMGREMILQTHQ